MVFVFLREAKAKQPVYPGLLISHLNSAFTRAFHLNRTGCYLIAPIVNPRTIWRETIRLKMITGRATSVPVAII
jgi:hypothetical protein